MAEHVLEVVLPTGERLRIGAGVDVTVLRTVLEALRRWSTCQPACVCLMACDMRKSFDSLHALVRDYLELDHRRLISVPSRSPCG